MEHVDAPLGEIHAPHNWAFADAPARAAAAITDAGLVGRIALQLDTGAYWRLTGVAPVAWAAVTAEPLPHTHDYEPANANIQAHIGSTANPHGVTAAQAGADPAGTAGAAITAHEAAADPHEGYVKETEKGAANGVATLGADSKIPEAQLPAIAITDTSVVASEAAMLALVAQKGDIAVRSDLNKTFALAAEPATVLANWVELRTPTDAVLSVAGRTGAVTLGVPDVSGAMAQDFSGLSDVATIAGTDTLPAMQGAATKKTTVQKILDWIKTQVNTWTAAQVFHEIKVGTADGASNGNGIRFRERTSGFSEVMYFLDADGVTSVAMIGKNASDGIFIRAGQITTDNLLITSGGYIKLGESAPAMKFKKLTGTTAATEGGSASVAHGLAVAKIIGVQVLVTKGTGSRVLPGARESIGHEYSIFFDATNVNVLNHATNSENILSCGFTVLITYEE